MNYKDSSWIYGRARYLAFLTLTGIFISCQPAFELSDGFIVAHNPEDADSPIDFSGDRNNNELSISAISPSTGPVIGNQLVTIRGAGFSAGIKVEFGSKSAAPVEILSDKELRVTLPAHLNNLGVDEKPFGAVMVTVSSKGATAQGKFTYDAAAIAWDPAVVLPADTSTYQGPTLLQIHNDIDGHGQTGIIIGKDKGDLAGVAWRWSDGTFDNKTYPRAGVGIEAPGAILGFSFRTDPTPDIFLTTSNALYQLPHDDVGSHSFKPAQRIIFNTKNNGFLAIVKHDTAEDMVLVDDQSASVFSPEPSGILNSRPISNFSLQSNTNSRGVVADKFNADNRDDLAILGQEDKGGGYVAVYLAKTTRGSFDGPTNYPVGNDPRAIVATDVNGDKLLDLVVAATGAKQIGVLLGKGDGTFLPVENHPTAGGAPIALRAGDLNGDGFPELVFLNQGEDELFVLRNKGSEGFDLLRSPLAGTGEAYRGLDLGDVDQDKQLDLVLTGYANNKIQLVLNRSLSRP